MNAKLKSGQAARQLSRIDHELERIEASKPIQPIGKLAIKIQLPKKREAPMADRWCELCHEVATEMLRDVPLCSICYACERGKYEP